jgi:hypothetical protein
MGAYVYYGPHPFVVANWPVYIGSFATLGLPLASYLAYVMRDVMRGAGLWLSFAILMPVVLYGSEVIAWPIWITLNGGQTLTVTHIAAVVSVAFMAVGYHVFVLAYRRTRVGREAVARDGAATA